MCFDHDDDGKAAISSAVIRKARKQHQCTGCGRWIDRGDLYTYFSTLFDGEWWHACKCGMCKVDTNRIDQYEREVEGCTFPESRPWLEDIEPWIARHPDYVRATREEGQAAMLAEIERREQIVADREAVQTKGKT